MLRSIATAEASMKRTAQAVWSGALKDGKGTISLQSGALKDQPYTFKMRFEDESGKSGTNPEELIAAAHASCFTMQLSHFLAEAGHPATKLTTDAEVTVGPVPSGGQAISKSALTLRGSVPGIDEAKFRELADKAKAGCPVSKALGAIEITLDAKLEA
jgi:lipoyl-dependent peroxiredoxin